MNCGAEQPVCLGCFRLSRERNNQKEFPLPSVRNKDVDRVLGHALADFDEGASEVILASISTSNPAASEPFERLLTIIKDAITTEYDDLESILFSRNSMD